MRIIALDFEAPHNLPFGLSIPDYSNTILTKENKCRLATDEEYQILLNRLSDDVYITDDLRDWANEFD